MAPRIKPFVSRYRAVVFFTCIAPGTLTEVSLIVLSGQFAQWQLVVSAVLGGLVSGLLLLLMKAPELPISPTIGTGASLSNRPRLGGNTADSSAADCLDETLNNDRNGTLTRMRLLTPQQVGVALMVVALLIMALTAIDTPLGWWRWFGGENGAATMISSPDTMPAVSVSKPLPILASPLELKLEAAKTVQSSSARDQALRIVAETALELEEYNLAIEAGDASPIASGKSKTLKLVALCAAKRGHLKIAMEAADKIPYRSVHDATKVEILSMTKDKQQTNHPNQDRRNELAECRF